MTRGYDDAGRLQTVQDWLHPTPFTYSYDPNSNVTHLAYPVSGTYSDYPTYDNADRLQQLNQVAGGQTVLSLAYTPDPIGLTLAETPRSFTYDPLNRLRTEAAATTSTYSYDGADRLYQISGSDGRSRQSGYDNADQLQTFTDTQGPLSYGYQYDNNGNRTQRTGGGQTLTYGWDQANRMVGYQDSKDPTHNSVYTYNGDGLRLKKRVNGVDTVQSWDVAEGLPLLLREQTGSAISDWVTGLGGMGMPLEMVAADGTSYYYHTDKLGSTRALSNDAGTVAATYDYDAYGNLTSQTRFLQPFQFAGQYTDAESGLQYLQARYYDPAAGQFMSRDPLALTRHPYVYVADSPIDRTDPQGLYLNEEAGASLGLLPETSITTASQSAGWGGVAAGLGFIGASVCHWLLNQDRRQASGNTDRTNKANVTYAGRSQSPFLPRQGERIFNPQKNKTPAESWSNEEGGFVDDKGNVWRRDLQHTGSTGEPHWDVDEGDSGYTRVADDGRVIGRGMR